jgi:thimet oligopeptidase
MFNAAMPLQFLRLVSGDTKIVDVATGAFEEIEKVELSVFANQRLYKCLRRERSTTHDSNVINALDRYLRDMEVRGASHIEEQAVKSQIDVLSQEIAVLESLFQKNIAADESKLMFTRDELLGMDESFLGSLTQPQPNSYTLTLQYPHLFPVLRLCERQDTRERMWRLNAAKASHENASILPRIIALRHQRASLLGFTSDTELSLSKQQRIIEAAELHPFLDGIWEQLGVSYCSCFSSLVQLSIYGRRNAKSS